MSNLKATLAAFLVAAAFFNFAIAYRPMIILVIVVVVAWLGLAWLIRRHPLAAIALLGFLRGLLGSRR